MLYAPEELERHWRSMVRVAHSVLGSRPEAEECAASAIVQVLERQPAEVDNLEAFLVTVAKRRALDSLRALDRSRRRDARLAGQLDTSVADVAEAVVARAEARWMQAEARTRLSRQSYRILEATADGEGIADIAAREGLTVRAAQSDLFRSRRLLRSVWARALSVLGATWAFTRRITPQARATAAVLGATAAATAVFVPGGPHAPHAGTAPPARQHRSTSYDSSFVRAGRTATAHPHAPMTNPTGRLRAVPNETAGQPRTLLVERDPAGRTTVTQTRHGRGAPDGALQGALDCLHHLGLDPHQLGC
jgi:DNA-directed RNA polymerase specialized sigma24 family protein